MSKTTVMSKGKRNALSTELFNISLMVEDMQIDNDLSKGHLSALSSIMESMETMCQVLDIPVPAKFMI